MIIDDNSVENNYDYKDDDDSVTVNALHQMMMMTIMIQMIMMITIMIKMMMIMTDDNSMMAIMIIKMMRIPLIILMMITDRMCLMTVTIGLSVTYFFRSM